MKTSQFLPIAQKLIETGLFSIQEKGERNQYQLGITRIGRTDTLNTKLWRKYGTLSNIVLHKTAEEVNKVFLKHNIVGFCAKPTKSGLSCRIELIKN